MKTPAKASRNRSPLPFSRRRRCCFLASRKASPFAHQARLSFVFNELHYESCLLMFVRLAPPPPVKPHLCVTSVPLPVELPALSVPANSHLSVSHDPRAAAVPPRPEGFYRPKTRPHSRISSPLSLKRAAKPSRKDSPLRIGCPNSCRNREKPGRSRIPSPLPARRPLITAARAGKRHLSAGHSRKSSP